MGAGFISNGDQYASLYSYITPVLPLVLSLQIEYTDIQTQTHRHTDARMHVRTHIHARTHARTHAHAHTHTHTHTASQIMLSVNTLKALSLLFDKNGRNPQLL